MIVAPKDRINVIAAAVQAAGAPDFLNRWLEPQENSMADNAAAIARIPKRKPRKIHPADEATAAAVASADHFEVSLFVDGRHIIHSLTTLAAAREAGLLMEKVHQSNRLSIVYAVSKEGRSFMVPRDLIAPTTPTEKPMSKSASAASGKTKKASKAKRTSGAKNARYDWKAAEESAGKGIVPPKPDFSAPTHKPWLGIFDEIVKATEAKDMSALRKIKINPTSSTPKAMDRFRSICLSALKATPAAA